MWSDDQRPALPSPIASGIAEWAARDPERLAVCDPDVSVTFAELDARAAALAGQLAAFDTRGHEAIRWLPVVVDRSARSAIALAGAVRAGAPFVPIDSTLPQARVADLMARLERPPVAVVATPEMADLLPLGMTAIAAETDCADHAPLGLVSPGGPGFVVFTSGSTGAPKGVIRRWASLEWPILDVTPPQPHGAPLRFGVLQPFSFVAGLNALDPLSHGNTLHVVDPASMEADELLQWLDAAQVNVTRLGPAIVSMLVRVTGGERRLPSLDTVQMGGQASGWEIIEPLRALASQRLTVISSFAATESGPAMRHVIGPDTPIGHGPLPIGRPIDPARIRLEPLDDESGRFEVVIADPAALAYLGDPDLTAKRFTVDHTGRTWWRSGDVVTVDETGVHHHRGRIDDMVKINGLLVEPAEAESALRTVAGLTGAAVLVHTTPSGAQRLIAHVEVDDDSLTPEAVRAHLELTLPKHLVPAMLVRHRSLPINERGKVDRSVLAAAEPVRWRSTPPRRTFDELELWLTGQLAEILDLGEIGADDDMWHLGLDSLGAVELCAVIADAGFADLDPTALLEVRSPAALARRLTSTRVTETSAAVDLNPGGARTPLFVIPGGGGTALAFRSLAKCLGDDQPVVVVEPRGMHRPGPVDRTIDAIVDHVQLQIDRRIAEDERCVVLGYSAGGTPAFELARRLHEARRKVHLIMLDTSPGPHPPEAPSSTSVGSLRRRSVQDLVRAAANRMRHRWLVRHPGPPRYDPARYRAFQTIISRANARYEPAVLDVPSTLIQVPGNTAEERCRPWLPDLTVHVVSGKHLSMLQPPHVAELATVVGGVLNAPDQPAGTDSL